MNAIDIGSLIALIDDLFPRSDWSDATRRLFAERIKRLDVSSEQARRVVEQHRVDTRFNSPDLSALLVRLTAAGRTAGPRPEGNPWTWPEWMLMRHRMGMPADATPEQVYEQHHARTAPDRPTALCRFVADLLTLPGATLDTAIQRGAARFGEPDDALRLWLAKRWGAVDRAATRERGRARPPEAG